MMSAKQEDKLTSVWHEVRAWPTQARLALVLRIVQSLEQEQESLPQRSPTDLIGIWKTDQPLSDQDIDQLLAEEKMKKYG